MKEGHEMITNDREYDITKAALEKLESALTSGDNGSLSDRPIIHRAMREGLESEASRLRNEMETYEAIKDKKIDRVTVSLDELADALVLARNIAGLTQAELAARLGLRQ